MKVTRSMFYRYRQQDAIATQERNDKTKRAERVRRDKRMKTIIQAGSLPYTPVVMSWLSRQLKTPSTKITQDDVNSLLA